MICPKCGEELPDNAQFCARCGTKLIQSICPQCGAQLPRYASYCHACGAQLRPQAAEQPAAVPETPRRGSGTKLVIIAAVTVVLVAAIVFATVLAMNHTDAADDAQQLTSVQTKAEAMDANTAEQETETDNSDVQQQSHAEATEEQGERARLRAEYQARIDALWDELDDVNNGRSQTELNQLSYNNYQHWDALLNEIYQTIKAGLSDSEFAVLKASEKGWIEDRDATADVAASDWIGGTGYAMIYNGSKAKSTGERCQWLLDNYLS